MASQLLNGVDAPINATGSRAMKAFWDLLATIKSRKDFLIREAHVDLLEVVSSLALLNLAVTFLQISITDIWPVWYQYLWHRLTRGQWACLFGVLSILEISSLMLNWICIRCWVQFAACLVFLFFTLSVIHAASYAPTWKDFAVFTLCAGHSHIRLRRECAKAAKKRRTAECLTSVRRLT